MAASGQDAGAALAAQDAAAGRTGGTLTSLSRAYVDGYAGSARFGQQVGQLGTQMELDCAPPGIVITLIVHNVDTAAQDFGAVLYGEVEEGGDI